MINTEVPTIWAHNDGRGPTKLGKIYSVVKTIIELVKGIFSRRKHLKPGRMMNTTEYYKAQEWLNLPDLDVRAHIVKGHSFWERNHIVVSVHHEDHIDFYDAKGYSASHYGLKFNKKLRENTHTDQFDSFNCGVHVIHYLYKTYKPDAKEFSDINTFRRFLAEKIS